VSDLALRELGDFRHCLPRGQTHAADVPTNGVLMDSQLLRKPSVGAAFFGEPILQKHLHTIMVTSGGCQFDVDSIPNGH